MTRRAATPDKVSEALALREAGYTALSISQRLGISTRSLQRHFTEHGAKKGAIKRELLESARAELMKRVISDDAIREEAARLINDDLAHAIHLRNIMVEASALLSANTLSESVLVMRAAAAYSTAIKNTSDTLRQTLRIERTIDVSTDVLPELFIHEMSQADVIDMKNKSLEEAALLAD